MIPVTDAAPVAIDFEGFYDKKRKITIKDLGAYHYLRHPEQDIYLVSIYDGEQLYIGRPEDFDWSSISGRHLLSHNRSFDKQVYLYLVETGKIDAIDVSRWDCTADMATYLKCKRNLKDASMTLLTADEINSLTSEDEVSKKIRTKMNGLHEANMRELVMAANGKLYPCTAFKDYNGPSLYDLVVNYAGDDAKLCWAIWHKYGHLFPERERRLSRMTTAQAIKGLFVDKPALTRDVEMLKKVKEVARQHLPWAPADVEDEEGILSIPKFREACLAIGVTPPSTTSEDSQILRQWELKHPEIRYSRAMRDYRKANIIQRRAEHILQRIKPDGRFSFAWLYGGAHTLRWAGGSGFSRGGTGETGFNVQNQQKEPVYITKDYEIVTDLEHLKEIEAGKRKYLYKVDMRARVIAPPGKKLIIFDAAQIEPRIQKWLVTLIFPGTKMSESAREDLDRIAAGESIYEVHARKTMGWKGGNLKKENPKKQFFAKQRVLGLGYCCGHVKYRDKCAEYHMMITLQEAKADVTDYRAKEKGITSLWRRLDNDFKACRGGDYEIELPNGIMMTYFDVHSAVRTRTKKAKPGAEDQDPGTSKRLEMAARTERGGRIRWFYGGLIFENVVQRIAREIMADMLLACDDNWPDTVLFHVHDEGVLEVDEDVQLADVVTAVSISPDWAEGLPVEVEAKESPHYLKD
jgi:hypothetical protein